MVLTRSIGELMEDQMFQYTFIKTNQNPSYININSNHPKNIIKQVSKAVNLRICKLSANEKIFKEISMPLKIVVLRKSLRI